MAWDHKTWDGFHVHQLGMPLVGPLQGIKPIRCKWVLKRKTETDGNIQMYKARLIAKDYKQRQVVDFNETFLLIAMLNSIRIFFSIVAYHDYKI